MTPNNEDIDLVSSIAPEAWFSLPESRRMSLTMLAYSADGIDSREALAKRLLACINATNLQYGAASRMATLNRRFYKAAGKFGTKVSDVVHELIAAGLVRTAHIRGVNLVSTKVFSTFQDETLLDLPPLDRETAIDRFYKDAQ